MAKSTVKTKQKAKATVLRAYLRTFQITPKKPGDKELADLANLLTKGIIESLSDDEILRMWTEAKQLVNED